eukprot:scaffold250527_cov18-Tisochrysis_lutea.AAC.3
MGPQAQAIEPLLELEPLSTSCLLVPLVPGDQGCFLLVHGAPSTTLESCLETGASVPESVPAGGIADVSAYSLPAAPSRRLAAV